VIDPTLVKKERLSIDVEIQEGEHYGKTSEAKEGPKVEVCLGVDARGFLELFLSRLG
jgi:inosine-uridine nucleoside N-ribohydrolase